MTYINVGIDSVKHIINYPTEWAAHIRAVDTAMEEALERIKNVFYNGTHTFKIPIDCETSRCTSDVMEFVKLLGTLRWHDVISKRYKVYWKLLDRFMLDIHWSNLQLRVPNTRGGHLYSLSADDYCYITTNGYVNFCMSAIEKYLTGARCPFYVNLENDHGALIDGRLFDADLLGMWARWICEVYALCVAHSSHTEAFRSTHMFKKIYPMLLEYLPGAEVCYNANPERLELSSFLYSTVSDDDLIDGLINNECGKDKISLTWELSAIYSALHAREQGETYCMIYAFDNLGKEVIYGREYVDRILCSERKSQLKRIYDVYTTYDNDLPCIQGVFSEVGLKGNNTKLKDAWEWVNSDAIEESCPIYYSQKAIEWCRDNAPDALKNSSDMRLWNEMRETYTRLNGVV